MPSQPETRSSSPLTEIDSNSPITPSSVQIPHSACSVPSTSLDKTPLTSSQDKENAAQRHASETPSRELGVKRHRHHAATSGRCHPLREIQQAIEQVPPAKQPLSLAGPDTAFAPTEVFPAIHSQLAERRVRDSMQCGPTTADVPGKEQTPSDMTPVSWVPPAKQSPRKRQSPSKRTDRAASNKQARSKRARMAKAAEVPPGQETELELVPMPGPRPSAHKANVMADDLDGTSLLLDAASRKVSLISFGLHGPLNQGRWGPATPTGDAEDIESATSREGHADD